jgi:hypothetical protein
MAKVGCTSIIRALMEAEGCTDEVHLGNPHHNGWRYLGVSTKRPTDQEPFIFTFVRHPVARAISFWRNKLVEPEDAFIKDQLDALGLTHGLSFEEMVDRLTELDPANLEQHIRPQHLSLIIDGTIVPHLISKLEYVHLRWPVLRKAFDLPALRRDNSSSKVPVAISQETYGKLLHYFDEDFRAFNYNRFPIHDAAGIFGFTATGEEL